MGAPNATIGVVAALVAGTFLVAASAGVAPTTAAAASLAVLLLWTFMLTAGRVRWSVLLAQLRRELADRALLPLAAVVFAAALIATRSPLEAATATLAVVVVKTVTGLLTSRPDVPRPRLRSGSAAALWLARAEIAVEATRQLRPGAGPLAERFGDTRDAARDALLLVRRLGAHEATVARLLERIDERRLADDLARLESERAAERQPAMRAEIGRAIDALREQEAARSRLVSTDETLVARMRTAAVGLEGLVARLAEIIALAQGGADATAQLRINEVADELDALRSGLSEAESIGRATLHALDPVETTVEVGR